ncbi:MAG: methyltransferase domain-containing protein [Solirubrobacteraceae bacterium]
MPSREYHEALWQGIPEGLEPAAFGLRSRFLLGGVARGERVLDVGCGEGSFAALIAAKGADVVAADVAAEPLRRARARHPGLEVRLLSGEGAWELDDASFDVVWAGEVIEHVADTAAWLSELRRVLRSGGRLLLSTPSLGPAALVGAALSRRAFAARFDPRADHLRYYSAATLSALIADFGFAEIDVRAAGGLPGARSVLLARAVRQRF